MSKTFNKGEIHNIPKVNVALRPMMNNKYLKGFSGISFNIEGEPGEKPERLVFEVLQVIENALRESYGAKSIGTEKGE